MNLEECRKEIDRLDKELTNLLEQRMQVVAKVAAYKKENHMEIFDPRRERQVLDKIAAMAQYKDWLRTCRRSINALWTKAKTMNGSI